jgi:hypothetical protein
LALLSVGVLGLQGPTTTTHALSDMATGYLSEGHTRANTVTDVHTIGSGYSAAQLSSRRSMSSRWCPEGVDGHMCDARSPRARLLMRLSVGHLRCCRSPVATPTRPAPPHASPPRGHGVRLPLASLLCLLAIVPLPASVLPRPFAAPSFSPPAIARRIRVMQVRNSRAPVER